jgi:hypothetical protein
MVHARPRHRCPARSGPGVEAKSTDQRHKDAASGWGRGYWAGYRPKPLS